MGKIAPEEVERAVAIAIVKSILAQDYMSDWPAAADWDLKLAYLDQGEVDFGLVARAAISAYLETHKQEKGE